MPSELQLLKQADNINRKTVITPEEIKIELELPKQTDDNINRKTMMIPEEIKIEPHNKM